MNTQKKYRWKVLHRVLKETTKDKEGFILLPTLMHQKTMHGYPHLPKDPPTFFIMYLTSIYGIQKSEIKLLWRKYKDKINKLL